MAEGKTSVMRISDQKGVPYTSHHYVHPGGAMDRADVAALLDRGPASMYKTLVTQGASRQHYAFIIPILRSLDLKTAVRAVGEKSIKMIPQARLLPLIGYVHRGCSPVRMKRPFPTALDGSMEGLDAIVVSAGKIRAQVGLAPAALYALVGGTFAPVSKQLFLQRELFLRLLV